MGVTGSLIIPCLLHKLQTNSLLSDYHIKVNVSIGQLTECAGGNRMDYDLIFPSPPAHSVIPSLTATF